MTRIDELEKKVEELKNDLSFTKGRLAIMEHLDITMAVVAGETFLMGLNIALHELMEDQKLSHMPEKFKRDKSFVRGYKSQLKGLDGFLKQHRPEAPRDKEN